MTNFPQNFQNGLNADDDFELIGEGQYVNGENMRFGTTDTGAVGNLEVISGTEAVHNPYLPTTGVNTGIGGCEDENNNRALLFIKNSSGYDCIFCYDRNAGKMYKVLLSSQVEGGLNFSNFIHSCEVIDGKLVFTDNDNQPRYVNIDAGIKLNHSDYTTDEEAYVAPVNINLIKRPPIYRLDAIKKTDGGFDNNYVYNKAYKFRTQYIYKDYQDSALSAYSPLVPFNSETSTHNYVQLTLNPSEVIPDYVKAVVIWAKDLVTNKTFQVVRFDKDDDEDAQAIEDHNDGTANLTYDFYDNEARIYLDPIKDITPFDDVPLTSKTLEVAKDRLILANNLVGYDTPTKSSLTATVVTSEAGVVIGIWRHLQFTNSTSGAGSYYLLDINGIPTPGFYYFSAVTSMPPPAEIDFTTGVFVSADPILIDLAEYFAPTGTNTGITFLTTGDTSIVTDVTSLELNGLNYLKSGSERELAIVFYDKEKRKCGINKDIARVVVPERTYAAINYSNAITWNLLNVSTVRQIPSWAHWYCIVSTLNLKTRFFLQDKTKGMSYVVKNDDGTFSFGGSSYVIGETYAVSINISNLSTYGRGYTYTEGDMCKVYLETPAEFHQLRVLGQEGNNVMLAPKDLGTLNDSTKALFELYTPYLASEQEPYFEVTDMLPITNPGAANREFSVLTGSITGDITILERSDPDLINTYNTENMSSRDEMWKYWFTDTGWPNFIDKIGQQRLENERRFSDVVLVGGKVNGLNKFQPLNRDRLDPMAGEINRIVLANKVQVDGSVLLTICRNETFSTYLGESEVFDTQASAFVARTSNFLGTTRALQGTFGTQHPESLFKYNGLVKWFDKRNGSFVQYSNNGLFPISQNKFVKPSQLFALDIEEGQLVIGGIDPYHKEDLFSVPQTSDEPVSGFIDLKDGGAAIPYPFFVYDGKPKTFVYKFVWDRWAAPHGYCAETFIRMGNDLYSIYEGVLYKHNVPTSGTIYGRPIVGKIAYSVNPPKGAKTFYSVGLNVSKRPKRAIFRTEDILEQLSDSITSEMITKESICYIPITRDRLDARFDNPEKARISGYRMQGKYLLVYLEFEGKAGLKESNTVFNINQGHFITR